MEDIHCLNIGYFLLELSKEKEKRVGWESNEMIFDKKKKKIREIIVFLQTEKIISPRTNSGSPGWSNAWLAFCEICIVMDIIKEELKEEIKYKMKWNMKMWEF